MISIYDLKPKFQQLLRPVVNNLANRSITANHITIAAVILSVFTGLLMYLIKTPGIFLILPIVLFIRMALNAIDGMLANEHNMKSPLGAILNELGDVLSDMALYLPFVVIAGIQPVLVVIVVCLSIISEMTGVIAIQIGTQRRYDGPMGKSDRAFALGGLALCFSLGLITGEFLNYVLAVIITLLFLTIFNRANNAIKIVNRPEIGGEK